MSINLSAAQKAEFDSEVHHAFQGTGQLKETVTVRENVVGGTYDFRKMGKGTANQKATAADVTPMDVAHTKITATLANWNAPEYTDIFDAQEVNFNERQELAETIANALGRRCDQIIIDALDAATAATTAVDDDIGGSTTGLNLAKLAAAVYELRNQGVPNGAGLCIVISAQELQDVLNDTTISSADYNTVKLLMSGDINSFMGFLWKIIESRDEGGLSVAASVRSCWAYHMKAVGLAVGLGIKTEVNYVAHKTAWLANGIMKAGAAIRDTAGIVEIQTYHA